ncbi:MAG: hypothetical protein FWG65_03520, partial [Turicibacter sp.]|nr:hypothetical protein [Turicibacter sp.]
KDKGELIFWIAMGAALGLFLAINWAHGHFGWDSVFSAVLAIALPIVIFIGSYFLVSGIYARKEF